MTLVRQMLTGPALRTDTGETLEGDYYLVS